MGKIKNCSSMLILSTFKNRKVKNVNKEMNPRLFILNILNGVAIGTVIALIPGALLGEIVKALIPSFPSLVFLSTAFAMSNAMVGLLSGILIGQNFKFTPIQSMSLGLATLFGSGAVRAADGAITLVGTGDIINMGVTAAVGVFLIYLLGERLRSYSIIVIPPVVLAVAGGAGFLTLPYVAKITKIIGIGIEQLLTLQPVLLAVLLGMIFAILIVSPITSVGIAVAISLSGIGSGAGNLGITAAGFGLAIMGWTVNDRGTSLAHFIGSPKMQMPNVLKKPLIMVPILCSAAACGLLAAIFNIQGTPMSAGFGFSGLVGPINYLNLADGGWSMINILIAILSFVIAPIGFGLLFKYVFTKLIPIVSPEDYRLDIK